ncbi:MAG: efflux RND transporter permease subunit, partial [bacterium]
YLTNISFSSIVFLGLILLVGIVVNNAIVLVEYMNQLNNKNEPGGLYNAVIEAASIRVRPILMTSFTTILGLVPLALGWGEGLELLKPLAITVIGGLGMSTLLTLFVTPVIYTLFKK